MESPSPKPFDAIVFAISSRLNPSTLPTSLPTLVLDTMCEGLCSVTGPLIGVPLLLCVVLYRSHPYPRVMGARCAP